MPHPIVFSQMDPHSFEHMVNALAMRVLGHGVTGFGPGADGGRDGYFEGEANYPSMSDRWKGVWYIQSKFRAPNLANDSQAWLREEIKKEIKKFEDPATKNEWPDNWIIASNIEPSGSPETGTFDRARDLVREANQELSSRFAIWGGRKIIALLNEFPDVRDCYGHFLTPGHVLSELRNKLEDSHATADAIVRALVVKQIEEQQYTKLEQAGSDADSRPGIHRLFIDLPFACQNATFGSCAAKLLTKSSAYPHKHDGLILPSAEWQEWSRHPARARIWFVKGGPGQGKSTIGQLFCQVQRAAIILGDSLPCVAKIKTLSLEIQTAATTLKIWPTRPRIPIYVELKEYAQWYGEQSEFEPNGVLTYLAKRLTTLCEQEVLPGTIKRSLGAGKWFVVFDGLDEVPSDVKDEIARAVIHFIDHVAIESECDLLALCTSRPQGYSGQFAALHAANVDLAELNPEQAFSCAKPVLAIGRGQSEIHRYESILSAAMRSAGVRELMRTPLQSHIMAIVVRDGGRPPDRRWQLFNNFYEVIRKREANKELADSQLAELLRTKDQLLRSVHNRLGFVLHAEAETSKGATTSLERGAFERLARFAVTEMVDEDIEPTVRTLMEATEDRLVLLNTPDDGQHLRFDIRPLQEFFAAEYLYESTTADELQKRLQLVAGDAHWREVVHFLLSALIENRRVSELAVAIGVLEELDTGEPGSAGRAVRRRLMRGSLLTWRLLGEGVLEPDRRVRQAFRTAIEPIASAVRLVDPQLLQCLQQANSRTWFTSYLLEKLVESDPSESVGAAAFICLALSDDDERCLDVLEAIELHGGAYVDAVITARGILARVSRSTPLWVMRLSYRRLSGAEWRSMSTESMADHFDVLDEKLISKIAASESSLTPAVEHLLREVKSHDRFASPPLEETSTVVIGPITIKYAANDWVAGDCGPVDDLSIATSSLPGCFKLLRLMCDFKQRRSKDIFLEAIEDYGHMQSVPVAIRSGFPLFNLAHFDYVRDRVRAMSNEEFSDCLIAQKIGDVRIWRYYDVQRVGDWNEENYRIYLEFERDWCLRSFFLSERDAGASVSSVVDELAAAEILNTPSTVAVIPWAWGRVLAIVGTREEELREGLRQFQLVHDKFIELSYVKKVFPFKVNLPLDAPLLPSVLTCIGMCIDGEFLIGDISPNPLEAAIQYGLDADMLVSVARDEASSNLVRSSAALLQLLHMRGSTSVLLEQRESLHLAVSAHGAGFLKVVNLILCQCPQDDALVEVVGGLCEKYRNNYEFRFIMEGLMHAWREASTAPVSRAGVVGAWLEG